MEDRAMVPRIWYRWLLAVIVIVMAFGVSMLLAPGWFRQFLSLVVYSSPHVIENDFSSKANSYIMLMHGVLGAVMLGWGLTMLITLRVPFRKGDPVGWSLIAVPVAVWFVIDTAFSLFTGFWQNAVLNTAFALMFAAPLAATRSIFSRARKNERSRATEHYKRVG